MEHWSFQTLKGLGKKENLAKTTEIEIKLEKCNILEVKTEKYLKPRT